MGLETPAGTPDPAGTAATLKEVKAKDGSILSYEGDTPAAGAAITLKNDKGEMIPVPDGNVELEDGTILAVKDGKIADVKPAEKKKDEPPAFDAKEEMKRLKTASEAAITELKTQYKKDLIDLQATIKKQSMEQEKQATIVKEVFSIIEKLAALPSAPPAPKKDGFNRTSLNPGLAELMASAAELSKQTFHN